MSPRHRCVGFRADKQIDKQTNSGENLTLSTAVGLRDFSGIVLRLMKFPRWCMAVRYFFFCWFLAWKNFDRYSANLWLKFENALQWSYRSIKNSHTCRYYHCLITSPTGADAKYCDEYVCVCLSVCPRGYLRSRTRDLYQIFVHIAYGCGSVLLWQGDEIPRKRGSFGDFLPHWQCIVQHSIWDPCKNGWTDQDAAWVGLTRGTVYYVGMMIPEEKGVILCENMFPTSLTSL